MKDYFFSKLGVRLMLLVAFAMAPVLCFIVFTGFEQREMAMEAARQDAMRVARMAGANHESLIEGAHQLLIALSRIPDVQSGDKKTCDHFFSDLIKKYPSYLNFGMTDALGNIYVSAIPIAHPISASDRSWYQRTRLALDFSVGDYQIGRITHQGTVNFGYPILDSNGNYKGAIFAALSLNWVNQLAAKAQLPGGGIVLVVDSKGMILARNSEPEKWVGKPFQEHSVLKAIEDHREEASIETEGFDGIKRLYAVTLLKGGKDDGRAYVCVGIPSRLAFDHPIHVLRRNLALLGLATLLAMGAAWFFGNAFVLKSIQTLLHTTRRLSAGDMGARTGLRQAPGEMGELATAFDQMAATLEKRVKERQIVEQALRQSEERSRRVFQDAATGMIVISTTGAFWQVNQAFCDFVEYLEDELEALNVLDVTHPEDREIVRQAMQFVEQSTQGTSRSIQRFVKKNGEIRQGELSLSRVTSSKGTPGFFVAQILDVTERVEAQRRLEEQHASLEQANRAKDEFIAMLSHELRTPLTPVLICIDSFQNDTRLSEEIQSAFSMIRRNIQLEARLIDDLLDVAKVTFGKVDLHLEILEAHALLRNTLEICDPAIVSKGLLVQLDFQAEHHVLRADPSRPASFLEFGQQRGEVHPRAWHDFDPNFQPCP